MNSIHGVDGSGTAAVESYDERNLKLFQILKSEPSTLPSALKSPALQAAVNVNLLLFQMLKSEVSTDPSKLASPGKNAAPGHKRLTPAWNSQSDKSAVSTTPSPFKSKVAVLV